MPFPPGNAAILPAAAPKTPARCSAGSPSPPTSSPPQAVTAIAAAAPTTDLHPPEKSGGFFLDFVISYFLLKGVADGNCFFAALASIRGINPPLLH